MFWHHEGFRHSIRVITAVWGVIWVAIFVAWTVAYGARQKKKFERMAAERDRHG